jgi:uncharacterized membrane protein
MGYREVLCQRQLRQIPQHEQNLVGKLYHPAVSESHPVYNSSPLFNASFLSQSVDAEYKKGYGNAEAM